MKQLALAFLCATLAATAHAAFVTGFEAPDYVGSMGGTILTGQQDWYLPVVDSADYKVYTYIGNPLGIPWNPDGGAQFAAGRSEGAPAYGRAQHDFDWGAGDVWTVTYDVCPKFNGELPATDYLGSFSLQDSTVAAHWQTLYACTDLATSTHFNANYMVLGYGAPGISPGDEWAGLQIGKWYRQSTTFELSTQRILQVTIQNLSDGGSIAVYEPADWFFLLPDGGTATGFRFFTGGSTAGNIMAWDNFSIVPEPSAVVLLAFGLTLVVRRR